MQTIGRAARNADGRVIMYADKITGSMDRAIGETNRRRSKQMAYNEEHGITPETIRKNVVDIMEGVYSGGDTDQSRVTASLKYAPKVGANLQTHIEALRKDMLKAAENLEFEEAARLRDEINRLEEADLTLADDALATPADKATEARSMAGRAGTRIVKGKSQKRKF